MTSSIATGLAIAVTMGLTLTACVAPPTATSPSLRRSAPVTASGPAASRPAAAAWPDARWWQSFADPQLDALVVAALETAPSLHVARARLAAADAATATVRARMAARLAGSAGLSRDRLSENGLISSHLLGFEWYDQAEAGLHLDLDLDWWGRERAAIDAAVDQGRAAAVDTAAGELLLVSSLAAEYLAWQNDGERLAGGREVLSLFAKRQELQRLRSREGVDETALSQQLDVAAAAAREGIAQREASQSRHRLALAALLGVVPEELPLGQHGIAVVPPVDAPSDLSLGLIAQRPDIVASRWRVEAGLAGVAEARAGYYPDLRLSALAGLSSLELSKVLNAGSEVASLGASVYLPVFDIRGVRARYGVRRADLELAVASYDEVVVAAAREVAEQLLNCRTLVLERAAVTERLTTTQALREAAAVRSREGMDDARLLIGDQIEVLQQRDVALELDGELAIARLALIKALGGGVLSSAGDRRAALAPAPAPAPAK